MDMPASVQGPVDADVTLFSWVDLWTSLILQQWQWALSGIEHPAKAGR